ncbi:hypothetical protein BGW41_008358 [Actinomortierella wolfii]|nr:hypothetical protein BGW41_008358 [Actinomortierella wolfii]
MLYGAIGLPPSSADTTLYLPIASVLHHFEPTTDTTSASPAVTSNANSSSSSTATTRIPQSTEDSSTLTEAKPPTNIRTITSLFPSVEIPTEVSTVSSPTPNLTSSNEALSSTSTKSLFASPSETISVETSTPCPTTSPTTVTVEATISISPTAFQTSETTASETETFSSPTSTTSTTTTTTTTTSNSPTTSTMDYTTTTEPPSPTTTTSSPPTTTTTSDEPTTTTTTTTSYTTTTTYEPPPTTTTTRDDPTTTTTRSQTSYVPSSASSLGPGPPPTHTPSGGDSSGMSTGGIVGIAIGAAAALILVLGLLLVWVRRHRRRRQGEMSFSPILPGMQERQRPTGTNAVAAAAASTTSGRIGGGANGGSTNGMGRDSFEPLSNGYHQSGISARTDTTHAASSMAPLSALAAGGTAGALMANGCQQGDDDEANLRQHRLSGGYYDAGDYHMAMNDPHGGISYQQPTDDTGYAYSQDHYDPNYAARMHQQQQQMFDEANYASHEQPYATDAYYSNMYDEAAAAAAGGGYGYNQYPADYYGATQGYSHPDYTQGHSMYYDPTTPSPSVAQSSTPSSSQLLHPTTSAAPGAVPTSAAGGQGYAYPESDARWSKKTVSPSETPLAAGIAAGAAGAAGALASSSSTKDTRPISTASLPPEEIKPSLLQQRRQQAFQGQQQQRQPSPRASPSLTGSPSVDVVNADSAVTPPLATTRQSSLSQHSSQNESQMPQGRTSIVSVDSTGTGATRSPQTVDKTGVAVGSPSQSDVEEDLQHLHSLRNSGTSTDWSPRNPQTIIRKDPQMGATGEDYSGPSVIIDDHDASYKVPLPEDHGSGSTK